MNKMLSAIALSAFMATAAQAEQPQANAAPERTAADLCVMEAMDDLAKDISETLNGLQDVVRESNSSIMMTPSVQAIYSKEFMRAVVIVCEAITQTKTSTMNGGSKITVPMGDNSVTFER
ncbi:MAG: hypothetical protein LRY54_01085 [Alphaproteobacteria bacterium]|nr:hypothetical protein [Alphaproteobacteria bacterium]